MIFVRMRRLVGDLAGLLWMLRRIGARLLRRA